MNSKPMRDFCRLFHQDSELYGPTWEDMIAAAIKIIGKNSSDELHIHLHELLNSNMTDEELADLWDRSGSEIGFGTDANHRSFLQLAYEMTSPR